MASKENLNTHQKALRINLDPTVTVPSLKLAPVRKL